MSGLLLLLRRITLEIAQTFSDLCGVGVLLLLAYICRGRHAVVRCKRQVKSVAVMLVLVLLRGC